MKRGFKQVVITGMTLAMVVGGATSAFAKNDRDRFDDRYIQNKSKYTQNNNNKNNNNNSNNKPGNSNGGITINNNGTMNFVINFNDISGGDVEWAIKNIMSLASKKIFEGYEDGTFKPRATISRVEAITAAVRLLGLEDKAKSQEEMSTKLNFKDADKIPSWAVGYVAVALENDLFAETMASVEPSKPADRLWATTLLVKAMKLDDEARAKMNTKLSFRDASAIPAGSVGYVAVAVEKGLIQGFEDNTFRPNQPVTRAQMAALIDRTSDQMPEYDKDTRVGKVTAAVSGNVLVTVKDGTTTTTPLAPNAFVFRNGVAATLADIQVGDEVKIKMFNNVGYMIEVTKNGTGTPANTFTIDGTLSTYPIYAGGYISAIGVTQTVYGQDPVNKLYQVSVDVNIEGSGQLIPGTAVQVKGTGETINYIKIK
ncbi:S-layer homology domain-containing protein [Paenibacillus koleovorans]|uniref:S-layer homology domain-containing protein n=1 Tax=Paenibacillus koleovorans TaxID=121608 RepID=UPI000FD6E186|nr:S-layer homology domain-containing protein [Paenibacillus koleovorans]